MTLSYVLFMARVETELNLQQLASVRILIIYPCHDKSGNYYPCYDNRLFSLCFPLSLLPDVFMNDAKLMSLLIIQAVDSWGAEIVKLRSLSSNPQTKTICNYSSPLQLIILAHRPFRVNDLSISIKSFCHKTNKQHNGNFLRTSIPTVIW